MKRLMNVENTWNGAVEADLIEVPIECITEMSVENALSAMKLGKALGPSGVSSKMVFGAGRKGKKLLIDFCNLIIAVGRMPSPWELSTPVPIFKGKSDPLQCGSH